MIIDQKLHDRGKHATAAGLRQIEIDVFADPNGTLFSTAAGLKLAGGNGTLSSLEYAQSGFKVLSCHVTMAAMRFMADGSAHNP